MKQIQLSKKMCFFLDLIRILFYLIFFGVFLLVPTSFFEKSSSICIIHQWTGFLCPTCGVTRAFSSLMHFKFKKAFHYHPIFTISFGPIFIFLFLQDLGVILYRAITKKTKLSIIEYTFLHYLS